MSSAINIALPAIGQDFSMNATFLGRVASSYLLAAVRALVPFGRIADLAGRKRILAIGIGAHTIFSLGCALAPTGSALILFRVFQGFGAAMMFASERHRHLGVPTR